MSNEWYTSAKYIDAAREVMGGIDLDPASCEIANQVVRATRYYSQEENGLLQPWYGRVWLNPPFSKIENRSGIGAFTRKLVREYQAGNVRQAVLLVTIRTEAEWYQPLFDYPICFSNHIVHFYKPGNKPLPEKDSRHGHFFGTSFVYLGPNEGRFTEVFSRFGRIVRAIDTPAPRPVMRELWQEVACD